jgi:hypothetical protein
MNKLIALFTIFLASFVILSGAASAATPVIETYDIAIDATPFESVLEDTTVYLSPDSETSEGSNDELHIHLGFDDKYDYKIDIRNDDGEFVKNLADLSAKDPEIKDWDGTDEDGEYVADGEYTVYIYLEPADTADDEVVLEEDTLINEDLTIVIDNTNPDPIAEPIIPANKPEFELTFEFKEEIFGLGGDTSNLDEIISDVDWDEDEITFTFSEIVDGEKYEGSIYFWDVAENMYEYEVDYTAAFTKSVVVAIPTVQHGLDEDLESTVDVTITLTNNGESSLSFNIVDFTMSDLKYTGLESSGYATDREGLFIDSSNIALAFTPGSATIDPTEIMTLIATITVPKEGDLDMYGTYSGALSYIDTEDKLGTSPLSKDMSVIVNPPHKSGKLDIDIDFDDDTHYRTEDVEITVTIDNKHSEKAKSIKVELEIPELGIKEEASKFSLSDGDEKELTFEFTLDDDVDAGNYPIYVYVTGESEDSNDNDITIQNFDVSEELEIDVESDDLIVDSVKISDDELKAGESFVATVKVSNIGSSDQDDVRVRFECSDLDISELSDISEELRDGKTLSKVFNVKVPASADDGSYLCEVAVMYDGYKDQDEEDGFGEHLTKQVSLVVSGGLGNNVDKEETSDATVTGTATASVAAGSEARFILNLKNTDTSGSETYVIDFEGVSWAKDARIEPDEITIPAGTDVPFYVYLTPEAGTSGTKTAEVVVYVDNEEVASKTLTVTVRDGSGIQVDDLGNQITGSVVGPIDMPTAIIASSVVAGIVLLGAIYMFTLSKKL